MVDVRYSVLVPSHCERAVCQCLQSPFLSIRRGPLSTTAPNAKGLRQPPKISPEIKKSDRSNDKYCPKPLRDSALGALSNVGTFRLARKVLIFAQSGTTEIHP